jgi:methyl-accepting chemotaxis protein
MKPYKRRKFFIDKKLQTKYILLTMVMLLFYTMALVFVLFIPYILPLELGATMGEQVDAARMLLSLHKTVWPAIGVVIVVTGVMTIFVSHGVAGPVYRFKKVLAEVAAGNLNINITLRKHDDLKDLADAMNAVIAELRGFVKNLRDDHENLTKCVRIMEQKLDEKTIDDESGRELIKKMQESRSNIAKALEKYSNSNTEL